MAYVRIPTGYPTMDQAIVKRRYLSGEVATLGEDELSLEEAIHSLSHFTTEQFEWVKSGNR